MINWRLYRSCSNTWLVTNFVLEFFGIRCVLPLVSHSGTFELHWSFGYMLSLWLSCSSSKFLAKNLEFHLYLELSSWLLYWELLLVLLLLFLSISFFRCRRFLVFFLKLAFGVSFPNILPVCLYFLFGWHMFYFTVLS